MCRLRLFYFENGEWGWAEWILPYDVDIKAHIKHWKQDVRMVIHEPIDLVQICKYMKQQLGKFQLIEVMKTAVNIHATVRVDCHIGCG